MFASRMPACCRRMDSAVRRTQVKLLTMAPELEGAAANGRARPKLERCCRHGPFRRDAFRIHGRSRCRDALCRPHLQRDAPVFAPRSRNCRCGTFGRSNLRRDHCRRHSRCSGSGSHLCEGKGTGAHYPRDRRNERNRHARRSIRAGQQPGSCSGRRLPRRGRTTGRKHADSGRALRNLTPMDGDAARRRVAGADGQSCSGFGARRPRPHRARRIRRPDLSG